MMNCNEVISLYETVADITDQMLAAARRADWDQLAALEARCSGHIETLKSDEPPAPLPGAVRERKVQIIQKILADDRAIRTITEPWMAQLSNMMNSASAERKLSQAYGSNHSG